MRLVVQVVTVTLETWVGFGQVHEEPTIRPAAYARGASVGQAHRRAILDARGDLDREGG